MKPSGFRVEMTDRDGLIQKFLFHYSRDVLEDRLVAFRWASALVISRIREDWRLVKVTEGQD